MKEVKLVMLGAGGCGKKTYVNMLLGEKFNPRYFPAQTVSVVPVVLETPEENITFNIWTPPGQDLICGIQKEVFEGADCAIIMLCDSKNGVRELKTYKKLLNQYCPGIPMIVLFNKCELDQTMKLFRGLLDKDTEPNILTCSCRKDLRLKDPLVEFARLLSNSPAG